MNILETTFLESKAEEILKYVKVLEAYGYFMPNMDGYAALQYLKRVAGDLKHAAEQGEKR